MITCFTPNAWEEYLYWQKADRSILKKINSLIKEIHTTPYEGSGKPESLKHELNKYWSRRINLEHRLVYNTQNDQLNIIQCRYHY